MRAACWRAGDRGGVFPWKSWNRPSKEFELLGLNQDEFGILAAESQMVSPDFDFYRIAQRSEPDQLQGCADEQAHFQEATTMLGRQINFADRAAAAELQGSQRLTWGGHSGDLFAGELFDHDFFREPVADAQPGIANLADQAGLAAKKLDLLFLAETHFAETMSDIGRGGKLFDANIHACAHGAKRAQKRLGARLLLGLVGMIRRIHLTKLGWRALGCKRD
jgi:hypothetical protein